MVSILLAAAQSTSVAGDIATNVPHHTRFIAAAHHAGVDLLVFPELSLCGYEPAHVRACVVHPEDKRLTPLRDLACEKHMTVVVGAPVVHASGERLAIGAISYFADGGYAVYCKQHLHPGEERFATPGTDGCRVDVLNGQAYALAICADTNHNAHAAQAARAGAALYLAGVMVSEAGFAADAAKLRQHAEQHQMGVLMANHGGPTGGYLVAGKSAFWEPGGALVVQAPGTGNVLVLADNHTGVWRGEVLQVNH